MINENRILHRESEFSFKNFTSILKSELSVFKGNIIEFTSLGFSLKSSQMIESIKVGDVFSAEIYEKDAMIGFIPKVILVFINECSLSFKICVENQKEDFIERNTERFKLSQAGILRVSFENPIKFNDEIVLNIVELSTDGAMATTSLRNKTLISGMVINNARISFHSRDYFETIKIIYVRLESILNEPVLYVGLRFINSDIQFKFFIVEQILKFSKDIKPSDFISLRNVCGNFKQVKNHLEYKIVNTEEEYHEVLKLRLQAYGRVGKIEGSLHWKKMSDEFDSNSIIIAAKLKGKIVGSGRLTFSHNGGKFELESSIDLPVKFTEKREITCEVSRLCVDDAFLNTNLIHGIFEFGIQYLINNNTKWVISSTEKKLIKIYKRIGFRISKKPFYLKTLSGLPHYFMYGDVNDVIYGKMNILAWGVSYGNVLNYLKRKKIIEHGYWSGLKFKLSKILSKIYYLLNGK